MHSVSHSSLQQTALILLATFTVVLSCHGQDNATCYFITPDNNTNCNDTLNFTCDYCLTLDGIDSKNISMKAVALFFLPGDHTLTKCIDMHDGLFSMEGLGDVSSRIECTPPASFLFENVSNLTIRNTAMVSCGALQITSVQQFILSNVTFMNTSISVLSSNGLVRGAKIEGNAGAGINITKSTVVFEEINTFTENLNGGIASYNSTINFIGENHFKNNTAMCGGGISAIKSSILNFNGTINFEDNFADKGGGLYASESKLTNNLNVSFVNNVANISGGGVYVENAAIVDFNGTNNFTDNKALGLHEKDGGGGLHAANSCVITINGRNIFKANNAKKYGGGILVRDGCDLSIDGSEPIDENSYGSDFDVCNCEAIVHDKLSGHKRYSNVFMNNSADIGGGVYLHKNSTVNFWGNSMFIKNNAILVAGGIVISTYSSLVITGSSTFCSNSAYHAGGIVLHDHSEGKFEGNSCFIDNFVQGSGGGITMHASSASNIIGNITFLKNSASQIGGGVAVISNSSLNVSGTIVIEHNSANIGGGIAVFYSSILNLNGSSSFKQNCAEKGGAIGIVSNSSVICSGSFSCINNFAQYGAGLYSSRSTLDSTGDMNFTWNSANFSGGGMHIEKKSKVFLQGLGSMFSDNWSASQGGGISIQQSELRIYKCIHFVNNNASYGGAIQAFSADIVFYEDGNFTQNFAEQNGGAFSLAGLTKISFSNSSLLSFQQNVAQRYGGAISIEQNAYHCINVHSNIIISVECFDNPFRYVSALKNEDLSYVDMYSFKGYCYFDNSSDIKTYFQDHLTFKDNTALAGSTLFGGAIDTTDSNIGIVQIHPYYSIVYTESIVIKEILEIGEIIDLVATNVSPNSISSPSNKVCQCIDGKPDCDSPLKANHFIYPGQTIVVSLVAVGQRNGIIPSTIIAQYDPDHGASFDDTQYITKSHNTCSAQRYTIFSKEKSETIKIFADGECGVSGTPLIINVNLFECPIGFKLSNDSKKCDCDERLQMHTDKCNISDQTITRTTSETFWLGIATENQTERLLLYPHCPFDYCKNEEVSFTLNNSDSQCQYNRSGLLCGGCKPGLSLALGSTSSCKECPDQYLALIIGFALAGIALVILLFLFNLTVTVGTINGFIFYANNMNMHIAEVFSSSSVFISWVNLDLGINTCFFNGMDAYSDAWLQYAFPVYLWVLAGILILASRYSVRISRCLGTNPVAVLATLFLLSYLKILNSVFTVFLSTPLALNSKIVWLLDGNVEYLKGKHIPLFLTALLALFLLFIPFTLLLLLGQWIQAQSERKCCTWISDYRIKTFLDAYHGPFKDKHRYWCGLLLIVRCCLFLVFAVNSQGDPIVNFLITAFCMLTLMVLLIWFKVYKKWYLNVLEASFIMNLLTLAVATISVKYISDDANQTSIMALLYTSCSVAGATFFGILLFHAWFQLKDTKICKKLLLRFKPSSNDDDVDKSVEIEYERMLNNNYAVPQTTSVVELSTSTS